MKQHTRAVPGPPDDPLSRQDVEAKATDPIAPVACAETTRHIIERIWSLEKLSSARKLQPLLQG